MVKVINTKFLKNLKSNSQKKRTKDEMKFYLEKNKFNHLYSIKLFLIFSVNF